MVNSEQEKQLRKSISNEKIINKEAIEILARLNRSLKIAKIYEPNNLIFVRQIQTLFNIIQNVIEIYGEVSFMLRQSTLFINGIKIRFSFSNYNLFRFLRSKFQKREISELSFKSGFSDEELKQFILLLAKKLEKSKNPFKDFLKEMKQSGIKRIAVEKISPFEMYKSDEKYATKVFFLGITHLKETFEMLKKEEKIPLNTTRRLMQSIFNHIVNNESFTYGLTTIKNFDEYTLNHSVNVCILSISLGRRLGLDRNEIADLGISAFFHDFGKTEIPREILVKPGKLDEEEREIIERHPHIGAGKLAHLREFSYLPLRAIHVALEHHVKEDFSGYPKYQMKKNVNLYSKIVQICDFFDALTTKRPYREKVFTREEALEMIIEKSGTDFDPIILKVFVNMIGRHPVGSLVLLNTGEVGIVFELNMEPSLMQRPKVKLIADKEGNKIDGEIVDLTEMDSRTMKYKRTIMKSLDPYQYNVKVSDYFLAQAQ